MAATKKTATKRPRKASARRKPATPRKPTKREARQQPTPPREEWTVDGNPIPDQVAHLVPFEVTDQGIERLNATSDRDSGPRVEVGSRFDKQIEQRADGAAEGLEIWEVPDPIKETIDSITGGKEDGFKYKLLSEPLIQARGKRGWQICMQNGDPVKMASMPVGRMPKKKAAKRNEHYRKESDSAAQAAAESIQAQQEKIIRDEGPRGRGIRPLRTGEVLEDELGGEHNRTIGLRSVQGNTSHFTE
jgi:hypothetical protein